ncbi:ATP-binding protein [Algibacter miyuki]|uniref:ATP-binding protein n=1 Tax=Algibacter miyuki TaxID=1306933 RepID=A0ABV5H4E7_9FLAO|nr:ATP-binding protein [Algibacter miyuki]MDN3663810.1 ATP-binding protein [Algibacter miyuki]
MMMNRTNAKTIESELIWFQKLIFLRGKISFEQSSPETDLESLELPDLEKQAGAYAELIKKHRFRMEERLVLILALIPHVKPALLDMLHMKNTLYDIPFTEFGGVKNTDRKGYMPTGETAMFLLAGDNLEKRFACIPLFEKDHIFYKEGILLIEKLDNNTPFLKGQLSVSQEYLSLFTTGEIHKPDFSANFPAKRIYTTQDWSDLVLSDHLFQGIEEIKNYIQFGKKLKHNFEFGKRIKPGFKVLFTGPSGTGKTLTATLLGKHCKLDVYRVDLSQVVSKYIGETEKNLSRVFDKAESKNWILFFDEADALFGKRSNVSSSNDRHANQEVSFLLQRLETFDGLVILCSNFKKNIDEAFFRRFQLVLDFEIPDAYHRSILWRKSKTDEFEYAQDIDIENLSETYELTAASIVNILHYSILKCLSRNDNTIVLKDIQTGIKIEKIKEGKSIV